MQVALTGATGFIGSHVLAELQASGHAVTALVRGDDQAQAVAARGATPVVIDLYDTTAVANVFRAADAAVHTASPNDETSAALTSAVVDASLDAFSGTGKPFLTISGGWVYGSTTSITEASPFNAPAFVAWYEPIARRILERDDLRGVVIVSGTAYGDAGGAVPGVVLGSPRDDSGRLIMLGTGEQHWATVHVADLAQVFRRALENASARGLYVVANGTRPTVAEITEAAAVAVGAPGAVAGSEAEARSRLGDFAEGLLLDQAIDAARVRNEFGWNPTHPTLVDDLRSGSYRRAAIGA